MKKIIAITAMAAAVAGFSFADEPTADVNVAEVSGNASVTWGVDLDDTAAGTFSSGFRNEGEATLKVNFANKGSKSTEGDGVYGELKVEVTQNVGFKSHAGNSWDEVGGNNVTIAEITPGADGMGVDVKTGADGKTKTVSSGTWDPDAQGKIKVAAAKLHFGPVYVGVTKGDTKVGAFKVTNAIMSADNDQSLRLTDVGAGAEHGIVAGYGDDNFGFDVDLRSTPVADDYYNNGYGMAIEAKLKDTNAFVPGLFVDVGYAMPFANNPTIAVGANAGYKLSMGDTFYLQPSVAYTLSASTVSGATPENNLVGGVMFGWGATADANAGVPYLDGDYAKKVTPGVGVAVKLNNLTPATGTYTGLTIVPSFYSGDLIPNLKAGVAAEISTAFREGATVGFGIAGGAKYTIAVGDSIKVAPYAGARFITGATTTSVFGNANNDNGNVKDNLKNVAGDNILNIKAGCEFTGLISNTTFDVWYQSRNLAKTSDGAKAGTINLKCKIAL